MRNVERVCEQQPKIAKIKKEANKLNLLLS